MITFEPLDPRVTDEHLGFLPMMFDPRDPEPAAEQAAVNYAHGGGWNPLVGWKMDPKTLVLRYPGDPPFKPLAKAYLPITKETIVFYGYSWVAVIQDDGCFEVSRMD
jgi:hypothetical protein